MQNIKELLGKVNSLAIKKVEQLPYSILPYLYDRISTKELLHSEIIASLLDSESDHNCGNFFLFTFFKQIELKESLYANETNFKIDVEFGIEDQRRIDILITWEDKITKKKSAIIIENKLNDATDQKDQLKDYYTSIYKEYEVLKIVYIPRDQKKYAPSEKLDKDIRKLICVLYPKDLIKWLSNLPMNEEAKDARGSCINYSNILKYMNIKNHNMDNANELLNKLSNEEIKVLVSLYNTVKIDDLKVAVFAQIKESLKKENENIKIEAKEKNKYVEIYFEEYKFWIELYFYFDLSYFTLWIATNESDINPTINNLGFKYHGLEKKYHYYKNENFHIYKFPSDDKYKKLVDDILDILKLST